MATKLEILHGKRRVLLSGTVETLADSKTALKVSKA